MLLYLSLSKPLISIWWSTVWPVTSNLFVVDYQQIFICFISLTVIKVFKGTVSHYFEFEHMLCWILNHFRFLPWMVSEIWPFKVRIWNNFVWEVNKPNRFFFNTHRLQNLLRRIPTRSGIGGEPIKNQVRNLFLGPPRN